MPAFCPSWTGKRPPLVGHLVEAYPWAVPLEPKGSLPAWPLQWGHWSQLSRWHMSLGDKREA